MQPKGVRYENRAECNWLIPSSCCGGFCPDIDVQLCVGSGDAGRPFARAAAEKLVLSGLSPNSIVFADRPVRSAGHELTAHILEEWQPSNQSPDSFYKDPPNATVSAFVKDGSGIRDAVVILKAPKLEGDQVTFDVDVLEGDLTGGDGAASIFIDLIGRPFTPLSFAGVARRTAFRGAYYRGAAIAAGAGALGAAAYYAPYAYRPVCGYYPYPPCY
jgi:hypothetical protein